MNHVGKWEQNGWVEVIKENRGACCTQCITNADHADIVERWQWKVESLDIHPHKYWNLYDEGGVCAPWRCRIQYSLHYYHNHYHYHYYACLAGPNNSFLLDFIGDFKDVFLRGEEFAFT